MTHEVTISANGKAEIAYAGQTPWHGLGQQMPDGANWSIDDWAREAGMDWTLERAAVEFKLYTGVDQFDYHSMPGHDVLFRSDTGAPLSVMSSKYKIVNPRDVLNFFDRLCKEAGFEMETAGTLFGGRQFWALAKIGSEAAIKDPRDKVKGYLLLSSSCDGSRATEARFTPIRVVCNNTITAAIGDDNWGRARKTKHVRVRHRSEMDWNKTYEQLGIVLKDQFTDAMALFQVLANTELSEMEMIEKTAELFHPGAMQEDREVLEKILNSTSVTRVCELAVDKTSIGAEMDGCGRTAWGWLNAVTQYVDHEGKARTADARLSSAWFGQGAELKERAIQMVVQNGNGTTSYRDATDAEALNHILSAS